ncbi:PIH1 domain-containing protein 1 [Podochytrium sp. JEL0797]|nr:PIH1 domain-containing protein 1 [Podochytrium sp. JEL0797]
MMAEGDNSDLIARMLSGNNTPTASSSSTGPTTDAADGEFPGSDEEFALWLQAMAKDPNAAALLQSAIAGAAKGEGALPFPEDADPAAMASVLAALSAAKSAPPQQPAEETMMQIKPKPGIVVKTHLTERKEDYPQGMKVFINLCHSGDIPPPPTMDYEEVARAMQEGDNVSFKVPLSLSSPKIDKDKAGKLCLVFDAACNTTPFEHCQKNAHFHAFMVTLCCEWIESKHDLFLSRDISFPKLKSKGEISVHTIRKQAKSIISEMPKAGGASVSEKGTPAVGSMKAPLTAAKPSLAFPKAVSPHHEVFVEPQVGQPEFFVIRVQLRQLTTIKNTVDLYVEPKKLILTPIGKTCEMYKGLEIPLSGDVVVDEVGAQFDLSTRALTVTLVCAKN